MHIAQPHWKCLSFYLSLFLLRSEISFLFALWAWSLLHSVPIPGGLLSFCSLSSLLHSFQAFVPWVMCLLGALLGWAELGWAWKHLLELDKFGYCSWSTEEGGQSSECLLWEHIFMVDSESFLNLELLFLNKTIEERIFLYSPCKETTGGQWGLGSGTQVRATQNTAFILYFFSACRRHVIHTVSFPPTQKCMPKPGEEGEPFLAHGVPMLLDFLFTLLLYCLCSCIKADHLLILCVYLLATDQFPLNTNCVIRGTFSTHPCWLPPDLSLSIVTEHWQLWVKVELTPLPWSKLASGIANTCPPSDSQAGKPTI